MGWEILAPLAKWGAALAGFALLFGYLAHKLRRGAKDEVKLEVVEDALENLSEGAARERRWRDSTLAEQLKRLQKRAERRRSS